MLRGGSDKNMELPDDVDGASGQDEIADKFKLFYSALYNSASSQHEMSDL